MNELSDMTSNGGGPTNPVSVVEVDTAGIEGKLQHILDVYPQVSPSMLQIAMNPLRAGEWRPALERLISEGKVHRYHFSTTSAVGRSITYTVIRSINPHEVLDKVLRKAGADSASETASGVHTTTVE